jgi:hypothetical protein
VSPTNGVKVREETLRARASDWAPMGYGKTKEEPSHPAVGRRIGQTDVVTTFLLK